MYFCKLKQIKIDMKNRIFALALLAIFTVSFISCNKTDSLLVSSQDLWFDLEAGSKTITLTANCKWSIVFREQADWYTVSPTSGTAKDSIITVTVKAYPDGDFRGSYFIINSPGGHIRRTVFVSQNKLDFDGIVNKVFGVYSLEHWNTDYFGQIIEETYKHKEYNPYDTTQGYLMFFMENGKGVQRDRHKETPVYYEFEYRYTPYDNNLHIEFETVDGSPESYDAQVLCASDSLYRIFHEYKASSWERADHRKIGNIIIDSTQKAMLRQKAIKRKGGKGIYQMD